MALLTWTDRLTMQPHPLLPETKHAANTLSPLFSLQDPTQIIYTTGRSPWPSLIGRRTKLVKGLWSGKGRWRGRFCIQAYGLYRATGPLYGSASSIIAQIHWSLGLRLTLHWTKHLTHLAHLITLEWELFLAIELCFVSFKNRSK